ncbi:hypothetical protein [Acinetobacter tjernbergiae]|uniref:Uncharacterized protein n=2 Tax=Acinetobacter TaxID=469 RepID=V2W4H7_9GAMM|nr:hypothetical protein [Acinetobacter tjernbergiae]ESK54894.1 hypothetical protein F990_02337 [Acinetobacter tjernbergiae DSM 14971 = CIP 107465]
MVNGQLQKLNSILFEVIDEDENHIQQKWHNAHGEFIYSTESSDKFELRFVKPNGEIVDYDNLHEFLKVYKPVEFGEIRNDYLNQIVKENT